MAHVDMDSCLDVVIGAPGEDLSGAVDAGVVHVIFGSTAGLNSGTTAQQLSQNQVGGTAEAGDHFDAAVAAGDTLGTDTAMVVVGTPDEDLGSATNAGAINYLQYSDSIPVLPRQITQGSPGIPGADESGDRFGAAVALGVNLIRTDHVWEIVVGAPGEGVGSRAAAGAITVIADVHAFPPVSYPAAGYHQDSPGVPGVAEAGDQFGYSLAVSTAEPGHTPGSARQVAVGAPGEAVGPRTAAGAVNLFSSDGHGLEPDTGLTQDTAGVGGIAETGDRFGHTVALLSAPQNRLAVGVPLEDIGAIANAGAVQVFPLTNLAADQSFDADSPGAAGVRTAGGRYGSPLVAIQAGSENVFAVGHPFPGTGSVHLITDNGAGFAPRSWVPGSGGVPTGATHFGWSLGGYDAQTS